MHRTRSLSVSIVLGVSCICTAPAGADDIYKWRAPDGVVHYSETPPEAELAGVEVIELEAPQGAAPVPRDYRSALDVAKNIEAARLERERLRLEKRRLQSQRQLQASPPDTDYLPPARIYYPPYYRYPPPAGYGYRYGRPHLERPPGVRNRPHPAPAPDQRHNSLAHIQP